MLSWNTDVPSSLSAAVSLWENRSFFVSIFFYSCFICVFALCAWYLSSHLVRPSLAKKAFSLVSIFTCALGFSLSYQMSLVMRRLRSHCGHLLDTGFLHTIYVNLQRWMQQALAGSVFHFCANIGTQQLPKFELPLEERGNKFHGRIVNMIISSCYVTEIIYMCNTATQLLIACTWFTLSCLCSMAFPDFRLYSAVFPDSSLWI